MDSFLQGESTLAETRTESLCPVCLERISAYRETRGEDVYLVKRCKDHGAFEALIWQGPPDFESWKRPKIPTTPPVTHTAVDRGCPFDCGLCPDHRQRSCAVLIEVTKRCDLGCAFCYADSKNNGVSDPSLETVADWFRSAKNTGGGFNIQLSGGEPTMRDDLPDIVAMGRSFGFDFIQLNTNGVRLARDRDYVKALKDAGLSSIFLQFDGTDDAIYRKMRGRDLLAEKIGAVEACGNVGLGVVLVPTVVSGVNDENVGEILQWGLERAPVVRAVHFQPVSYFGRYPSGSDMTPKNDKDRTPDDKKRLTLPWLMRAIETQSGGMLRVSDFKPPGCENALCSFHGSFLIRPDGSVRSLQTPFEKNCCSTPEKAEEGALKSISRVAGQWVAPENKETAAGAGKCCSNPSPLCRDDSGILSLDDFIQRARTHTFSVSAMAFQDAWNVDLERVRDCCIHVMAENGNLIPFCIYNLTNAEGKSLYRS